MESKRVEMFHSKNPYVLEERINDYCADKCMEPVSISVIRDYDEFVAFVVVEEKGEDSYD